MTRFAKLAIWYSVISCIISLLAVSMLLIFPLIFAAQDGFSGVVFFVFVASYFNCLPLAIISIFMFFKGGVRRYSIANFIAIFIVLYFVIKVFGKSI